MVPDFGGAGTIDARHRGHDAEHGGNDAESGQRIGDLLHRVGRLGRLMVVGLQLVLEQAFKLVRIEVPAGDQPKAIGDELHHVMVRRHDRVFLENGALGWQLDVPFDAQQSFLSGKHQDVVKELEQLHIFLASVAAPLHQAQGPFEGILHHFERIADEEGPECGAADDHDLERVP